MFRVHVPQLVRNSLYARRGLLSLSTFTQVPSPRLPGRYTLLCRRHGVRRSRDPGPLFQDTASVLPAPNFQLCAIVPPAVRSSPLPAASCSAVRAYCPTGHRIASPRLTVSHFRNSRLTGSTRKRTSFTRPARSSRRSAHQLSPRSSSACFPA